MMAKLTKDDLRILPPAAKYLKKIKDRKLKKLFQDAIDAILDDPFIAEEKTGDLKGVRSYDIYYGKINYEPAYTIEHIQAEDKDEPDMIIVILAGTRENFYNELKRYWK